MVRRSIVVMLLVSFVSLLGMAQEVPLLTQPQNAGYTPAQLTALGDAITQLQRKLDNIDLGSKRTFGSGGWTLQEFAAYTAGTLDRLGYATQIVSNEVNGVAVKVWVVVQVDLGGATAWIPVEPLTNPAGSQNDLGDVPIVGALVYDASYLSYDAVIELAPNVPPTAAIRNPTSYIVETERAAWFANASSDPDGEIVLFQWTFGDVVQRVSHAISTWYAFPAGGISYPVTVTVTDSRGAQATTSTSVYVLTLEEKEAKGCGCGGD